MWLSALPDFFGAVDGVTTNGDPIGNIWYTIACFAVAIACRRDVHRAAPDRDDRTRPRRASGDQLGLSAHSFVRSA